MNGMVGTPAQPTGTHCAGCLSFFMPVPGVRNIPDAKRDAPVSPARMTTIPYYPMGPEIALPECVGARAIPVPETAANFASVTPRELPGRAGQEAKRRARSGWARLAGLRRGARYRCAHGRPLVPAWTRSRSGAEPARSSIHPFRSAFAGRVGKRLRFGTSRTSPASGPTVPARTQAVESTAEGSPAVCDGRRA